MVKPENKNRIKCRSIDIEGFPERENNAWLNAEKTSLVDVVSGEEPFLLTRFSIFRSDKQQKLYIMFEGQDDEIHSIYRWLDEPLYMEDVFELFISDENKLDRYIELEVSPYDVHFDGMISYDAKNNRRLDMSYDIVDWQTKTHFDQAKNKIVSIWSLPYSAFTNPPGPGVSWRINVFRIDHSVRGRSLQAWQQTCEPNFHVPEKFGFLDFV